MLLVFVEIIQRGRRSKMNKMLCPESSGNIREGLQNRCGPICWIFLGGQKMIALSPAAGSDNG